MNLMMKFVFYYFLMQDLNSYLEDKVYLAGNQFTLADTLMYYGIHHVIVSLAFNNQTELTSIRVEFKRRFVKRSSQLKESYG